MTKTKHQYYSWQKFKKDAPIIAKKIKKSGRKFKNIYGPPRGGLTLAVKLSHLLGDLPILMNKRRINADTLIVDDIADGGKTLLKYAKKGYFIVTIFYKRHCKFVPNVWIREKREREIDFPWEKSKDSKNKKTKEKFVLRKSDIHGHGLYAAKNIKKGETVVNFKSAPGRFISEKKADQIFWKKGKDYVLQTDDNEYWSAKGKNTGECWFLNHSCLPNLGVKGKFNFVALRDIKSGEELNFDYAMSESSNYEMRCKCGNRHCRKVITGNNWKLE